ncbi:MAG TPA: cyclic 2,3-diphosphoglycerate synthase [Acidobacteriota bacterium]|nr:cyclic 2,3-diphosphoglycerate synthase [Acidobacteriota bacterium]
MGAAGRDFHNFNVLYRDNSDFDVVAFTATQIPNISGRKYPAELAGKLYPDGIPIYDEKELSNLIKKHSVQQVVFSYSDVSHEYVMHKGCEALASGADFHLINPVSTMLPSQKPVVSICAVRTGSGKSQTTRKVTEILKNAGKQISVIRHPMPYGDLVAQRVQRFATMDDLDSYNCTIEEREEYEPHITRGVTVFAGVDYQAILTEAEKESEIVVWDGGNNDTPFYRSNMEIVVADPHRPGHELTYFPGEVNFRRADVIVINKIDTASFENINQIRKNIRVTNPKAVVIDAASPIFVDDPNQIFDKRVLVIEDGPTLTHGGMKYGAGIMAAYKFAAREIVDPRKFAVGTIAETFKIYPDIGTLLPAMGYGRKQMKDLEETINRSDCDVVVIATPIDLRHLVNLNKPAVRVQYELQTIGSPSLEDVLKPFTS